MASAHVQRNTSKALRLTSLLRKFDVPQELLLRHDAKSMQAAIKSEYLKRAKTQHPDLASEHQKEWAEQRFKALSQEYLEATTMLDEGVRPARPDLSMRTPGSQYMRRPQSRQDASEYRAGPKYPAHKGPEMDSLTRARCYLSVGVGFFAFMTFMREFLVWSAGSTAKWYGAASLNPFWIRRYTDNWVEGAKKVRDAPPESIAGTKEARIKAQTDEKVQELKSKTNRGTSDFYTKRGISNTSVYQRVKSDWIPKVGEKVCVSTSEGLSHEANYIQPATKKGSWVVWILERGSEGRKRVSIQDVKPFDRSLGKCQRVMSQETG